MAPRNRSNPLALAVLVSLFERPMHPYEVATTLRQRQKHDSVRLNYGSLYAVVDSLHKRGLIDAQETEREGRLPERTVYAINDAGRQEIREWMTDLLSTPAKEYPAFEAALSFMPSLPPDEVVALLQERALRLEVSLAQSHAVREVVEKKGLPRLFWVEGEFATVLLQAELDYVRALVRDIETGDLGAVDWWRSVHAHGGPIAELPPFDLPGHSEGAFQHRPHNARGTDQ